MNQPNSSITGLGSRHVNTFNKDVPANYIAGRGRGAMGFTTRSDIGPAKPAAGSIIAPEPNFGAAPVGYVAGRGRGMGELAHDQKEMTAKQELEEVDRGDFSESLWDEFSGFDKQGMFSGNTPYDKDDAEADNIYDGVDEYMENRRKRKREQQLLDEQKKSENNRPKISDQFADLKRDLASVTSDQWDSIPDVGDHSLKFTQSNKKDRLSAVPDYLIAGNANRTNGVFATKEQEGGDESVNPSGYSTTTGLAEARGNVLMSKLDKMSDSVSGQTVVDPKGFMTELSNVKLKSDADIGDIKKARQLLGSVTSSNPKHGPGWIASAIVEEVAGKLVQARKVIKLGCEACPDSEDVWLEAARLNTNDNAKTILANAVRHIPTSVKIWLRAEELETNTNQKKIVLRRALEFIPNSVKLWKTAIYLENVNDARIMLARAVECIPTSVEMWLALAKLETHDNARKVLNQAREANPTEPATWITAAKLEEAHGNGHMADRIIDKMVSSLSQYQVVIGRETWINEAQICEASDSIMVCAAIINHTIHIGVDKQDQMNTWIDDAEACLSHDPPSKETSRAIYAFALKNYPNKKTLWMAAAMLEKSHGTSESLDKLLKEGVKNCPKSEVLWLMAAKERWLIGDIPGSRAILLESFEVNSESVQIWLAAVKLEWENNEFERARLLLTKARERAPSEKVWMKSALLEIELGEEQQALTFLDEAINKFPLFSKYYMMAGQVCTDVLNDYPKAREYYQKGLKLFPSSVELWCLIVRLEERTRGENKARSMLELARLKMNNNDVIWLESIRLERRIGNIKMAEALMAKSLQSCPSSGLLWSEELISCTKQQQKSKSVDALKKCDNDPYVIVAVARLFDKDRKYEKARKW
jgi:pre-mRNA-processing factor 6